MSHEGSLFLKIDKAIDNAVAVLLAAWSRITGKTNTDLCKLILLPLLAIEVFIAISLFWRAFLGMYLGGAMGFAAALTVWHIHGEKLRKVERLFHIVQERQALPVELAYLFLRDRIIRMSALFLSVTLIMGAINMGTSMGYILLVSSVFYILYFLSYAFFLYVLYHFTPKRKSVSREAIEAFLRLLHALSRRPKVAIPLPKPLRPSPGLATGLRIGLK